MLRVVTTLVVALLMAFPAADAAESATGWQTPPEEVMTVLHAPQLPWVWTSPTGENLLLADPVLYPPLAELAGPMHRLAGIRVDPSVGNIHGRHGGTSPRLVKVEGGAETALPLPDELEVLSVSWSADGTHFALTVREADHLGLWVGSLEGHLKKIERVALSPLLGTPVRWMPDQKHLLVRRVPERGAPPEPPSIPAGPEIQEGEGAKARSTYESRNLLETAHDDELFTYYTTSELVLVEAEAGTLKTLGKPATYATADFSPDGEYLLVEYLVGPWSHAVPWWRFASEVEVWDATGKKVATIASLPLADEVPIHGVPLGPREVAWRATAPHELYWIEALDGGNPVAEADHRDRLMRLRAPFTGEADEIFKAEHRMVDWGNWAAEGGTLMLIQYERIRRWAYAWLLDVDEGSSRLWYDLNVSERYKSPGSPVFRTLANGRDVMHQKGDAIYFEGSGATPDGDRPFLDLRSMKTGETERLFRCDLERYETFVAFAGGDDSFVIRSESSVDVPNYYLATLGEKIEAPEGEAARAHMRAPITRFEDPTPQLRQIEKRLVRYEREDGVPLSFQLMASHGALRLPAGVLRPGHRGAGERLDPTLQPILRRLPPLLPARGLRCAGQHHHAHDRRPRDHLRHLCAAVGGRRGSRSGQGGGDRRRRSRAHRHHRPQPRRAHGGQSAGSHRSLPCRHRPFGLA